MTPRTTAADAAPPGDAAGAARNRAINIGALSLSKLADGLIEPKIVLAWLLTALGAPAAVTGALVPVREAGALLPQLPLAPRVRAARRRKTVWAAGAAAQGLAALGIGAAALTLEGTAAGLAALGLLALLALARSACSVSHKDALARTVPKAARGRLSGTAASLASALVLGFAALLSAGAIPLAVEPIAAAVLVAGALWIAGALAFLGLDEPAGAGASEPAPGLGQMLAPLRTDPQLRRFVAARALLTPTAYALPFLVMLSAAESPDRLGALGPLMLASALASILSAWVWGRLADRSSRRTLMAGGALAAVTLSGAALAGAMTGGLGGAAGAAAAVFVAQIAYEGVRLGRKTHLTDMSTDRTRALNTALSNSAIGLVLLAGGGFGLLAEAIGLPALLAVLAALCAAGAAAAAGLREVQAR